MTEKNDNEDIIRMSNELIYQRHLFNREYMKDVFLKMSIPEYIALQYICAEETSDIYSGRTYLKELADKLRMNMRQISQMVSRLRDAGYVVWSHDGNGSDGTYVMITESGRNMLNNQEEIFKKYYGKVFEKFGRDNLIQLLQLMKQLETVMSSEMEKMEVGRDDDRADE